MGGFSFASVILSYFLVAGGLLTGTLGIAYLKPSSEIVAYMCFAAGSFLGGFIAARASRGSTIIEPAIGAVLLIATIVLMVGGTSIGKMMWHADGTTKFIAAVAGCSAVGALGGDELSSPGLFGLWWPWGGGDKITLRIGILDISGTAEPLPRIRALFGA